LGEAHARPFFRLTAPARVLAFAFLRANASGGASPAEIRERLDAFARNHGVMPAPEGTKHHRFVLPQGIFRWEEHTEFTTYVFMLSGEGTGFAHSGGELLGALPLPEQPGPHLVSIDMRIVPFAEREDARLCLQESIASHSCIEGDGAEVSSDFMPDEAGMVRFVIANRSLAPRRLGALARDVMEIEVYRTLALMGLPAARRVGPMIREIEGGLASLTADLVRQQSLDQGDELLARLTDMTARVEAEIAQTKFRFAATRAYGAILADRLVSFGTPASPEAPTITAFLERRNAPALRTCETMDSGLVDLAARLTRASGLLRTRIDVERAKQNNTLLATMNERTDLQLRLQQTVEGLSVAAISYYVIGILAYLLKGVSSTHLIPFSLDLVVAFLVPVVVLAMAFLVRRIRAKHGA